MIILKHASIFKVLESLGVHTTTIVTNALLSGALVAKVDASKVVFAIVDTTQAYSVHLEGAPIIDIAKGNISPATKVSLSSRFAQAINSIHTGLETVKASNYAALHGMGVEEGVKAIISTKEQYKSHLIDQLQEGGLLKVELDSQEDEGALAAPIAVPISKGDKKNILKTSPVYLKDAKHLYQPVHGSSSGSVYHVVGITKDFCIAARYKSTKLSIRVEGDIKQWEDKLTACGFQPPKGPQAEAPFYTSLHIVVPSGAMAHRAIGGVLGELAPCLLTPMPNMYDVFHYGV